MNRHSKKFYRDIPESSRWSSFQVKVETTDLFIRAGVYSSISKQQLAELAEDSVNRLRKELFEHIDERKSFMTSLDPIDPVETGSMAVSMMYRASKIAGVGPMAAVAGTIAELVGSALLGYTDEVIVENGGDIWMNLSERSSISVYSGHLYFRDRIGLWIYPEDTPCGICTSSGKIGPSLSFGNADSATVLSASASVADAAATALCNMVKSEDDLEQAVTRISELDEVTGVLVIFRDKMAAAGKIELMDPASDTVKKTVPLQKTVKAAGIEN